MKLKVFAFQHYFKKAPGAFAQPGQHMQRGFVACSLLPPFCSQIQAQLSLCKAAALTGPVNLMAKHMHHMAQGNIHTLLFNLQCGPQSDAQHFQQMQSHAASEALSCTAARLQQPLSHT